MWTSPLVLKGGRGRLEGRTDHQGVQLATRHQHTTFYYLYRVLIVISPLYLTGFDPIDEKIHTLYK